jgi:GT2 family glycosyltransferase
MPWKIIEMKNGNVRVRETADMKNGCRRPIVGVVVLHYRSLRDTINCLASLLATDPTPDHIVIVNNEQNPETRQELEHRFGSEFNLTLLHLECNHGFSGGMNRGINHLLHTQPVNVVLLLNNDTTVVPNFLFSMSDCLSSNSGYHVATPKILCGGTDTLWSTGERVCYPLLLARRDGGTLYATRHAWRKKINSVTGCAMAVRREVFEKIGLFDENYFAYVEDVDFCFRAHRSGFRFAYCPRSIVYHKASSSLGDFSPAKVYLNVRNKAYFIKKNIPRTLWPLSWTWYFATVLSWAARALVGRKPDVVRSIILAFQDVVNRRMGAPPWVK